jgi:hypothetical protein
MTTEEHKARHEQLHKSLDELLADFTTHTGKLFSDTPIMDLIVWSHSQTIAPIDLKRDAD